MTAPAPARARRAVTRRLPRAGLDGSALSVRAWLLLAAGTAGGLVFTGVYLAEGATRAGYRQVSMPHAPQPTGCWLLDLSRPLEHLIRRLCHACPLPAHSMLTCRNAAHWCAVDGSVERPCAARCGQGGWATTPAPSPLDS